MRIRQNHPIIDRIKVFLILFFILLFLWNLSNFIHREDGSKNSATIETLIENAVEPVGTTMYIWGGGWDDADSQAGATSTRIGLNPKWTVFASCQDEAYDFKEHRFERENGLDCSGYVGWVVYNTFETEDGQPGYVTTSTDMAESFANRGWGKLIENPKEFLPGDIVSMEGHVWISLGTCADGSVFLVHSSPPGVSVCGTTARDDIENRGESIAIQLAEDFMTEYYPDWQERYPNRMVSQEYLENVSLLRWSDDVMQDAKEYQKLSGEKILEILGQIIAR